MEDGGLSSTLVPALRPKSHAPSSTAFCQLSQAGGNFSPPGMSEERRKGQWGPSDVVYFLW